MCVVSALSLTESRHMFGTDEQPKYFILVQVPYKMNRSNEKSRTWQMGQVKEQAGFLISRRLTLPSTTQVPYSSTNENVKILKHKCTIE